MKRKVLTLLIAGGLILSSASTAFADESTTPRHDVYYQSVCTIDGVAYPQEQYDVNALFGHTTGIEQVNLHLGIDCEVTGPFNTP